jgi:hypothetical protein
MGLDLPGSQFSPVPIARRNTYETESGKPMIITKLKPTKEYFRNKK